MIRMSFLILITLTGCVSGLGQGRLHWESGFWAKDVRAAGDLDGDGTGDVLAGTLAGSLEVLSGRDGTTLLSATGSSSGWAWTTTAALGDVDGDAINDFAGADLGVGLVYVFSGADGSTLHTVSDSGLSSTWTVFGYDMDSIADLNGDGVRDLVIGAPGGGPFDLTWFPTYAGAVRVVSGADGTLLYDLFGLGNWDYFGHSVTSMPDLDGDGFEDIAVGAPQRALPPYGPADMGGFVDIYSGATGTLLLRFTPNVDGSPATGVGTIVRRAGDWDGDGLCDLVVSSKPGTYNTWWGAQLPVIGIHSSTTGLVIADVPVANPNSVHPVISDLDLDGDGHPDVVYADGALGGPSFLRVVSGATLTEIEAILGTASESFENVRLCVLGDISGDGIDEYGCAYETWQQTVPSKVTTRRHMAADRFAVGLGPDQTLSLAWTSPGLSAGTLSLGGGLAGGSAWLLVSHQAASIPLAGGANLLIPFQAPGSLFLPYALDASGGLSFGLELRQPLLDGLVIHVQGIAVDAASPFGGIYTSNGLQLVFGA